MVTFSRFELKEAAPWKTIPAQTSTAWSPSSAPPVTGTADEALQVAPAGTAVPLRPRSDQQPLPSPPRPRHRRPVPSRKGACLRDVGRGERRRGGRRVAVAPPAATRGERGPAQTS